MKTLSFALATFACVFSLAAPAEAKKDKPAQAAQQPESPGNFSDQPFPYGQEYVLREINGKAPPKEVWMRIDSTGHATGMSACMSWSAVFIVLPDHRLGAKAAPNFNEKACDPALKAFDASYFSIFLRGAFWDARGDELILKGINGGGVMRLSRSI